MHVPSVVAWGAGWAVAAAMVALASGGIAPGTFTWSNAVLIVFVAAAAFGVPTLYATRAAGARQAWLQTAVWATGAALAMMFWAYGGARISADDVGGPDVNVNTTETMRQRTEDSQNSSSWPEELVLAGRVLIRVLGVLRLDDRNGCRKAQGRLSSACGSWYSCRCGGRRGDRGPVADHRGAYCWSVDFNGTDRPYRRNG